MSTATETRRVVADRIPARVRRPDGHLIGDVCRVVLTRDELYIWADRDGQVVLDHQGPWTPDDSDTAPRRTWRIQTPDGHWTVERGGGCACDSPLKRFIPWTPFRLGRL